MRISGRDVAPPRLRRRRSSAGGAGSVEAHLVVAGPLDRRLQRLRLRQPARPRAGAPRPAGIARVVVGAAAAAPPGRATEISPSAQPVVSRATGLLYTLVKPPGFPDAWNLAAIDWRTGALRFAALAGEGLGYNSEGGAVVLGPDGAAYAGTFGGVVRFRDGG